MKALKTHVAGVDVHKEILAITVLIGRPDEEPVAHHFECKTFTEDLMAMGLKLRAELTDVARSVLDPSAFASPFGDTKISELKAGA